MAQYFVILFSMPSTEHTTTLSTVTTNDNKRLINISFPSTVNIPAQLSTHVMNGNIIVRNWHLIEYLLASASYADTTYFSFPSMSL